MASKFYKKYKDSLYWIYPLVILALIIFSMVQQKQNGDLDASSGADPKVNHSSSITGNIGISDSLAANKPDDSLTVLFATK